MMIGRNLLRGYGFVMAPLDPPALWRPPLGALLCALMELFTTDPNAVYRLIYFLSLTTFLITTFYAARTLWDAAAAHAACLFIVTSAALTSHLVNHVHSISHVAFLLAVGPAFLFTAHAFRKRTPRRLLAAGICWGFTYLARWETLLFFLITFGVLFYLTYMEAQPFQMRVRTLVFVIGFSVLFVPAAIYQEWAKARYGIWGPSALTTFYAAEAWVTGSGNENTGFVDAESKYGSLESNHNSVLLAMARNPAAVWARLQINIPKFFDFFENKEFFDPTWLVLLLGLLFDLGKARRNLPILIWLFSLCLCSTSICFFEIDSRYLVVSLPPVLLILCGGLSCLENWASSRFGRREAAIALICLLVLLGLHSGPYAYHRLQGSQETRGKQEDPVESARILARGFQDSVHPGKPAVLAVEAPSNGILTGRDLFLVSYYAGTAMPWAQAGRYRRDKIFSMLPKQGDYFYLPEEYLFRTDILLKTSPIATYGLPNGIHYYLFARPVDGFGWTRDAETEQLRTILKRNYPGLPPYLDEDSTARNLIVRLEPSNKQQGVDQVACGVLASKADGLADQLFRLTFTAKPNAIPVLDGIRLTYMELQRTSPPGLFRTANANFILGVALKQGGPLLNQADGGVSIPVRGNSELWLYACDDGGNRPGTTYRCRLRIGNASWIDTAPVRIGN